MIVAHLSDWSGQCGDIFDQRAKDSLFQLAVVGDVLRNMAAVPVDRTTRNNALLYSRTFDVFRAKGAIALFPEGGQSKEALALTDVLLITIFFYRDFVYATAHHAAQGWSSLGKHKANLLCPV